LLLALCLAPRIGRASRGNYVNRYSLDDLPFKDKDAPFWLLQQGKSSAPAIKHAHVMDLSLSDPQGTHTSGGSLRFTHRDIVHTVLISLS
jgi:hypothetical protein